MHHSEFIRVLTQIYTPKIYIELGLYDGETFGKVIPNAGRLIGVDLVDNPKLNSLKGNPKVDFRFCSTDMFFSVYKGNADFIFIDADHKYESALRDFENSLRILSRGGIIVMHDTDPDDDKYINPRYCGDSYKIVNRLESDPRVNILTFPVSSPGLSVISRKGDNRVSMRNSH